MSPFLIKQESLVGAVIVFRPDIEPALQQQTQTQYYHVHITVAPTETVENSGTYIMEGICSFVHSTIQKFGDAKLLYISSYFIGSTTQDVICL